MPPRAIGASATTTTCTTGPSTAASARLVTWCVTWRKTVIGITLAMFALAIVGFGFVQQQFFPSANRPELVVDLWLPNGASIDATDARGQALREVARGRRRTSRATSSTWAAAARASTCRSTSSSINANLAEFVVTTKSNDVRDEVAQAPAGYAGQPVHAGARAREPAAERSAGGLSGAVPRERAGLREDPPRSRSRSPRSCAPIRNMLHVHLDWNELSKVVRLDIDQNKARLIGVTSEGSVQCAELDPVRVSHHPVPRARQADRGAGPRRAQGAAQPGRHPRHQRARPRAASGSRCRRSPPSSYAFEDGVIWRRNREPDHHRAGRHRRQCPGARGDHADRSTARRRSAPSCRPATASKWAGPPKRARAARIR